MGFNKLSSHAKSILAWLDSDSSSRDVRAIAPGRPKSEPDRWLPFVFLHGGCLVALFTGWSYTALIVCLLSYCVRMFAITGFYHRYFSHRSFKTSRLVQCVFALIGSASMQRGPLWWAAHHRRHHIESDDVDDVHSPNVRGFVWSHIGWITSSKNMVTDYSKVRDFDQFPELRLINRFDWFMPVILMLLMYALGDALEIYFPELKTDGGQLVGWGFFVSTTLLFHATSSVNSFAHMAGYRRFNIRDNSRNNPFVALITFGEGWHNNHHKYSHCARQGFVWWEVDVTYYCLFLMKIMGMISDLKPVPAFAEAESATVAGDLKQARSVGGRLQE
ncbi:MAG: acyl-CoA desaturase [Candidatus Obscuribacterales bacterium]|nr:acyl-CoA desaturase [Candidatus Obscuribacterales bacterium]